MDVDYRQAFENAPVGQAVGRNRVIVACNAAFARIFRGTVEEMVGETFERLYPTEADFETSGQKASAFLPEGATFTDDRVMRRLDGDLFWVRVRGFTHDPRDWHADTLWVFTEIARGEPAGQSLRASLTPRERDVAAMLIDGRTGKEIGRALGISPRTVDIYRTRLLRKYGVSGTPALVRLLLQP